MILKSADVDKGGGGTLIHKMKKKVMFFNPSLNQWNLFLDPRGQSDWPKKIFLVEGIHTSDIL